METRPEDLAEEIKRLQRCMNDLVSVLALPAMWTGGGQDQIVHTLLDALLEMLHLDLVYVRLNGLAGEAPVEMVRVGRSRKLMPAAQEICASLNGWLGEEIKNLPAVERRRLGKEDISLVPLPLDLEGELGVIVAGSERADFPGQTERLLLSVAANHASIGLKEARLLSEQKRVSSELDERVAQRTRELATANEELRIRVGLLQHIPVAAWTLEPDGTPDFINRSWLEYTGQTLEFVRSSPEAWMTAVHPEDRETALTSFWGGVRGGRDFAMETRFRRERDGAYRWHLNRAVALRDAEGRVLRFVGTSTDIEDVKQSQENLRRAEEKTRLIIDTALDAVITMDTQGAITSWNKQSEIVFGWSQSEAIGRHMSDLIIPERDRPAHELGLRHFLATGEGPILGRRIEVTALRRNGSEFPAELEAMSMKLGQDWIFSAFVRDITESKRAEKKLRQSEFKLRQILDSIPGLVCAISPAGQIEHANRPLLEYLGKTIAELNAWASNDVVHPDDLPSAIADFTNSMATGTPYDSQLRYRRADGVYRWFHVRILPVRHTDGGISGWYGLITDIEERKRAEDELRRSEAFLAEGQRLNLTGSFSWRLDTDEIRFSEQLYRIFEFERDEPVTLKRIGSRVHPEDVPLLSEKIKLARSGINDHDYEFRLKMPDGSVKYLSTNGYGARDLDGRLEYLGAIQDVTERRRSEEALGKLRSELAQMARVTSLGTLTASIAHEVNQPLSGIVTNASTCLRMLAADPPNVDGALETARRTIRDGKRASDVIARLRALFGKKGATTEPLDLNEATQEVIALQLSELQRNRVIVRQELADDLPAVTGDRVQLQQVILNLIRNASDAMNGIDDRPRQLVIRTERDESDGVRLTVRDTGVGIDRNNVDKLFDPFYTTKDEGMGMGLSVSHSIIESHHGRLWATPNDGAGTTFSFSIPRNLEGVADSHFPGSAGTPAEIIAEKSMRKP